MTESRIPLLEAKSALAVATVATLEFTTLTSSEYWIVKSIVISIRTVGTNEDDTTASFKMYRDLISNSGLIDMSFNATDDISDTVFEVRPGRRIICIFSDMVTGNEATVRFEGERVMRGNRGF